MIGVWFKAGFIGLAGVVLLLVAILSVARATIREAASVDEQMLAVALLCSFVAFLVFSMSAPVLYTRYGWAPAALLVALRAVQIRRTTPYAVDVHTPRRGPGSGTPRVDSPSLDERHRDEPAADDCTLETLGRPRPSRARPRSLMMWAAALTRVVPSLGEDGSW